VKTVLVIPLVIVAPLLLLWAFVGAARLIDRLSGFHSLARLYASSQPPKNTSYGVYSVGFSSNGMGSVGADNRGVFLHSGLADEGILIPWSELEHIVKLGPQTILRERQTRRFIRISSRIAKQRPNLQPRSTP